MVQRLQPTVSGVIIAGPVERRAQRKNVGPFLVDRQQKDTAPQDGSEDRMSSSRAHLQGRLPPAAWDYVFNIKTCFEGKLHNIPHFGKGGSKHLLMDGASQ